MAQAQITQHYPPSVLKRIQKDLASLTKEPLINAAAQPKDNDLTFWDAIIRIPITHATQKFVDMHFNIIFPSNYPQSPPDIGFTFDFPYSLGASYKESSGPLKGKIVICLDILGNFRGYHKEWEKTVGSGWSPSYSVTSLLVNLQTILIDLDASLYPKQRDKLVNDASHFFKSNPDCLLRVPTQENIDLAKVRSQLSKRAEAFAEDIKIDKSLVKLQKLLEFEKYLLKNTTNGEHHYCEDVVMEEIDENLVCYVTGVNYTEDILGYGLSCVRQGRQINFSTPAELISKSAYDNGIRQSSNKQEFKYFLPAFINKTHAEKNPQWKTTLRETLTTIGTSEYGYSTSLIAKTAHELFSRLINTLVVEMMKQPDMSIGGMCSMCGENHPDDYHYDSDGDFDDFVQRLNQKKMSEERMKKSPSIAYFEAICSFWRTFYWLSDSNIIPIKTQGSKLAYEFTQFEEKRLKHECPDVGAMLASFSIFQTSSNLKSTEQFVDAYLDEFSVRCVKWWKIALGKETNKYGNVPYNPAEVFDATKVSRDITLFQLMFLQHVIGKDEKSTAELLDKTNGKAPEVLEKLQNVWRDSQKNVISWNTFLVATGCSDSYRWKIIKDVRIWLQHCVRRANQRGTAYQ